MYIDLDKVHVYEVAKVSDRRRLQEMAMMGPRMSAEDVKALAERIKRSKRVQSKILAQAPHLAWKAQAAA